MSILKWEDCYPTEESLNKLEEILKDKNIEEAYKAFHEALKENFYPESCGLTKIEVRGEIIDVWQYHTGGWSGNEDIINILKQSWLWGILLERYDRGGHYYFGTDKMIGI